MSNAVGTAIGLVGQHPLRFVIGGSVAVAVTLWRMGCVGSSQKENVPHGTSNSTAAAAAPPAAAQPVRPKVTVTETDRVMLQLKSTKDELTRLTKRCEISSTKDKEVRMKYCDYCVDAQVAKKLYASGQRERALLALKKQKLSMEQLHKAQKMVLLVETQVSNIESAKVNKEMFDALAEGNAALKELNDNLNVEDVERLIDESNEQADKSHEIGELLQGKLSPELEAEVEAELEALGQEDPAAVNLQEPLQMPPSPQVTPTPTTQTAMTANAADGIAVQPQAPLPA